MPMLFLMIIGLGLPVLVGLLLLAIPLAQQPPKDSDSPHMTL